MTAFLTDPPTAAMLLLLLALGMIGAWRLVAALARRLGRRDDVRRYLDDFLNGR